MDLARSIANRDDSYTGHSQGEPLLMADARQFRIGKNT